MSGATNSASSAVSMTEERIRAECRKRGGFSTPELNEKLYLHHLGFTGLGGLEHFTGCTVLYLSHNALSDLAPLACMPQLRMVYLSHNGLQSCQSLPRLPELITLDVSYNSLADLGGITAETLPKLETLLAAHNQLRELDGGSPQSVFTLQSLTNLDVSHNQLIDEDAVWPALLQASRHGDADSGPHSSLATCDFSGNGVVRSMRVYRKRVIALLPTLRFLDGQPIEAIDRVRAEAFVRGGHDEEVRVRAAFDAHEAAEKAERFAYLAEVRAAAAQQARNNDADRQTAGPSTYFLTQAEADSDNDDSNIYVPTQ